MADCGNCRDCVKCELDQLREWIAAHPFPSYKEMCDRIDKNLKDAFIYNAEYGKFNHSALEKIYNSNINKEMSQKIGRQIYERGGMQALQANCLIFKYCTPLSDAPFPVRTLPVMLESHWHGIGEFRM